MAARISVTGAGGFVGRRLVEVLVDRGFQVRALHRRPPAIAARAEVVVGDLREPASASALVAGAEVVIHCAAVMAHDEAEREMREVNVDATLDLVARARAAGARRFVFVSSVAVYGEGDLLDVTEERPPRPATAYGRTKVEVERALCASIGIEWVVLRPCAIYGSGAQRLLPYFEQLVRRRSVPLVRGGRTLFDLVHVDDVAQALWLAATVPVAAGECFHVAEGVPRTAASILALLGRAVGVAPRTVRVPYALARAANRFTSLATCWSRRPFEPPFDPVALEALREHRHFNIDRARRLLGFTPQRPLEQGLAEALARLRD